MGYGYISANQPEYQDIETACNTTACALRDHILECPGFACDKRAATKAGVAQTKNVSLFFRVDKAAAAVGSCMTVHFRLVYMSRYQAAQQRVVGGTHLFRDGFTHASQTIHQSFRFRIFRFLIAAGLLAAVAARGCLPLACTTLILRGRLSTCLA